ncbi:MAG: catechol 2,3-dioxygenase [Actinomycetota bacterium]|jgi:catechol 2,3-dioxygenase|nr:catechol 2,3-dioxygenase [Actinomycetota bacterium]
MSDYKAPDGTSIGHVHLKVSDLDRAESFYRDVLGFEVTARYGTEASFMSAGGYHHHIGLNTWHSKGAPPAPVRSAGLFHLAILYPTRKDLANAVKRVVDQGYALDGAADHDVSEAIYLHDPDNNGIELYRDRDRSEWQREANGDIVMRSLPLDIDDLLAQAD